MVHNGIDVMSNAGFHYAEDWHFARNAKHRKQEHAADGRDNAMRDPEHYAIIDIIRG